MRVLCVSSACAEAGVMVQMTATRAPLLVSDDCSSRVSLESRKGMWAALPSESLLMTVARVNRLLLMYDPSTRWLLLISARALSLPARSMRLRKESVRPRRAPGSASGPGRSLASMEMRMMVWEREEPSLNAVALVCKMGWGWGWRRGAGAGGAGQTQRCSEDHQGPLTLHA